MQTFSLSHRVMAASFLAAASMAANAAPLNNSLLGAAVPVSQATRSIALSANTDYVNVQYGEVVRFEGAGEPFAVKFDGVRDTFALNTFSPVGALDHVVRVYVEPDADNSH